MVTFLFYPSHAVCPPPVLEMASGNEFFPLCYITLLEQTTVLLPTGKYKNRSIDRHVQAILKDHPRHQAANAYWVFYKDKDLNEWLFWTIDCRSSDCVDPPVFKIILQPLPTTQPTAPVVQPPQPRPSPPTAQPPQPLPPTAQPPHPSPPTAQPLLPRPPPPVTVTVPTARPVAHLQRHNAYTEAELTCIVSVPCIRGLFIPF